MISLHFVWKIVTFITHHVQGFGKKTVITTRLPRKNCVDPYSRFFKSSYDDPKYAFLKYFLNFSHFRNELN